MSRPFSRWLPPAVQTALEAVTPTRLPDREADEVVRVRSAGRIVWVGVGIALSYVVLVGQASSLMLVKDDRIAARAKIQFEEAVEVRGARGDILDRNGRILATSVELAALHADPDGLTAEARTLLANTLAPHIERTSVEVAQRLAIPGRRDVLLARGLTPAQTSRIRADVREAATQHPVLRYRIWTEDEPNRYYTGQHAAAPLLGVVGRNGRGLAGLERTLDRTLRGETYKYVLWRDRKGRRVTPETPKAAPGKTVILTIDQAIQEATERALDRAMEETGAEAAFAAVVDAKSGDLLALANRPTQNANNTRNLDLKLFKNRAAMDAFEPGSVFKPFVAAAALEEGEVRPETIINCEGGSWVVGRKRIGDDHPKDEIPVSEVIKYSSNIGAAKLAFRLGPERTLSYLSDFGFGRKSGLDLPGETRGLMRSPDSIKPIELATTSYGHGVSSNLIQLAYAMQTLANEGVRMMPRLVAEVRDAEGELIQRTVPTKDRRVVSARTARETVDMMALVTEEGGTGTQARIPGYVVAGKTGTAWKHVDGGYSDTDRIGSFVGLVPAEDPVIAIAVSVDTPTIGLSYGGIVAGPAFSQIGAESLRLLGVEPDPALLAEEADTPPQAPEDLLTDVSEAEVRPALTWTESGSLAAPDLSGLSLRDTLLTLEGAGLAVRFEGTGRVADQNPAPGAPLGPGDQVAVVLR